MRGSQSYERSVWADQFTQPSVEQLRMELPAAARHLFDAVRKHLHEINGIREELAWYGDCWHWCVVYRTRLSDDPLAVMIPCPSDLQLALPLDKEFMNSLPIKRMKRAVRDGLELAQEPFDSRWGVWSLVGSSLLDDLQDLIELKLKHLAKRAG